MNNDKIKDGVCCPRCHSDKVTYKGVEKKSKNQRRFNCRVCNRNFYHPKDYTKDKVLFHNQFKRIFCPRCGSRYCIKVGYNRPRTLRRYRCKLCNKRFQGPNEDITYKCPLCKNEKLKKGKIIRKDGLKIQTFVCSSCNYIFEDPNYLLSKSNALNKAYWLIYLYDKFLKQKKLHLNFVEWVEHARGAKSQLESERKESAFITNIVVYIQKTHVSALRGRILYITTKSQFEERLFCDINERKILSSFIKYLRLNVPYKIISYDSKDISYYLPARCSIYRIKVPNWKNKTKFFKGFVGLNEIIKKSFLKVNNKIDFLVRTFDLTPANNRTPLNDKEKFEIIYKRIEFLRKNSEFNTFQMELLLKDTTYSKFVAYTLTEARALYELYYLLKWGNQL